MLSRAIQFDELILNARRKAEQAKDEPKRERKARDPDPDDGAARGARDEAMAANRKKDPAWHRQTVDAIGKITGFQGTFEALRRQMEQAGHPEPHHHNCWGTAAFAAIEAGHLIPTGEDGHMKTPRSHGRSSQILKTPK